VRRRLSSQAASKNKSNSVGPLSEISIADRLTPQIWKRIHIQKPSGVHTKIFLAGRPEGFAIRPPKDRSCPLYPQKRTLVEWVVMSALCQKRTYAVQQIY
jgi:hypothetical protein